MPGDASYLIRLDDACPVQDVERWTRVESVLDRRGVRPIVAIVPENADPDLARSPPDPDFWRRAAAWRDKGWVVGLHGWRHEAVATSPGMFRLHSQGKSEFAGLDLGEQRARIGRGLAALRARGLEPQVWVAPFHGMDRTTVEALRRETDIRIVSDGLAPEPYEEDGFLWLPQQVWEPVRRRRGVWTIGLHPNATSDEKIRRLDAFLAAGPAIENDLADLARRYAGRRRTLGDQAFFLAFAADRALSRRPGYVAAKTSLAALKSAVVPRRA